MQRAFAYRRTFAKELYPPVRACLEEAVRRDPGYADAWAMLAFAHLDAARYGLVEPAARPGEMAAGLEAAQRAVALAPDGVRQPAVAGGAALHERRLRRGRAGAAARDRAQPDTTRRAWRSSAGG